MILPILILSFSFLIIPASSGSEAPDPSMMVKPDCPSVCGNVSIPYPFGIGKECYHDEWFAITCNNHTNKPFLSKFNMEVTEVRIDYGLTSITVMNPVASNCDGRQQRKGNTVWSSIDLSGSPYTFSDYANYFVKSGCDLGLLINENITIGCETMICKHNEGICANSLHNALISYNISIEESTTRNYCTYAFLISSKYFNEPQKSTFANYTKQVPVDISWVWENLQSHHCNDYGCKCPHAHTGNPYLPDGCTIVKACAKCKRHCHEFTNTQVNFRCKHTIEIILDGGRQFLHKYQIYLIPLLLVGGVLILHAVGGLFLILLCAFCFRLYIVIKKRRIENLKKKFFIRNGGLLLKQHISSDVGSIKKTILFTSDELMKATDNYNENRILGQGGQGTVYKGMLTDGKITAIKKSKLIDESQLSQFINEVVILSQMNHRNIVNLLGCCLETEVPLLVYEFVVNGNLYDLIQNKSEDSPLSWKMRLQIATEVAGGLSYLHSASSVPIYHRDIKSTNILLDENYRAKISDFGTSRSIAIEQTHLTTLVYGTMGYLDPEYFQSSQFTDKSDVYSFGVVLAELLTGQKPISSLLELEDERSLATRFTLCTEEMQVFDMIDTRNLEDASKDDIVAVSQIATRCLNLNGKKRPTMKEVATDLEVISRVPSTIVPMSIEK